MAKNSQAKIAANARYDDKAYDKFLVRVPKGQKAAIQSAADQIQESVNGYVNKAVQTRMNELGFLSIIHDKGEPIKFSELMEKSGLSEKETWEMVDHLTGKKMVYTIATGVKEPNPFLVSLLDRKQYWSAPFAADLDKRIFKVLKDEGPMALTVITTRVETGSLEVLESITRLIAQHRVRFSLGSALGGGPTTGTVFYADPEAIENIAL